MSCRNCPDNKPIKIRVPNFGDGMLWYKAKHPFGEVEHTDKDGKVYRFNEIDPVEAPAEFQRHIYTLELSEKPIKKDIQEKKKGVSDDL